MNVGKYYVAGIPFDSENSLKHYGVKGMEWNKHKFGIDADTRFIKWIDPNKLNVGSYGKMAEAAAKQKYGAAAPTPRGRLAPVYNKQSVMNSAQRAQQNMKRQQWNNSPIGKASNFIGGTASKAGQAIGTAANQAGRWAGQQINNAANTIANLPPVKNASQQVKNVGNAVASSPIVKSAGQFIDQNITGDSQRKLAEQYNNIANNPNLDRSDKIANKRAANEAQAKADNTLFGQVGNAANKVGNYIDQNITGSSQQKLADQYNRVAQSPNADSVQKLMYQRLADEAQANANDTLVGRAGDFVRNIPNNVANLPPVKAASDFVDKNITGNTARNTAQAYQQIANDLGSDQYAQKAERAQEKADNTLFGRIGNAANAVGNWVGDRARDVGGAASGAVNAVGDWVGDRARDVGNFVNSNPAQSVDNTAEQARGGIGGFFDRIGDTVGGTANAVGDWAGNAFRDFGNLNSAAAETSVPNQNANNTADQARGGIGGFFDRVGNTVGGAVNSVGDWIGDRARDVGGAVSGATQNVGNFVTGNQARQDLEDAQNSFFLGRDGRVNAAQNAYNQTLPGMVGNAGNAISGVANKAAEGAKGFLNSAGQWVSGAAKNVKNTASKAASDATKGTSGFLNSAGQWVSNAVGNVKNAGNWVGDRARDVGNFVTGNQARQDLEDAQNSFFLGRDGRVNAAQNAYNQTLPGMVGNAGNAISGAAGQAGTWIGGRADDVGRAVSGAAGQISDFARNLPGNISGAAQGIGNFVTGNQARQDLEDAQNSFFLGRDGRVNAAQNAYNQTLPGMVGNAVGQVSDFVRSIPGNISGAAGQAGTWIGGRADDVADWWNQRNPFVRHDALNEKPDGVSDAFWEKFTADGGTREEYDRDWR